MHPQSIRYLLGSRSWQAQLIRTSELFDTAWYCNHNPGLSDEQAVLHYIDRRGESDPHPLFRTSWYSRYSRLIRRVTPLAHYIIIGAKKGYNSTSLFDSDFYFQRNGISQTSDINPLQHYLKFGAARSYDPHPLFDTKWYLEKNSDLAGSSRNALLHYIVVGALEGRSPHPLFDPGYYAANDAPSPLADLNLLEQFCAHEGTSNVSCSPLFHPAYYRYQLEVERRTPLVEPPLIHYLRVGHQDRTLFPHPLFDPKYYREQIDVATHESELVHYCKVGDDLGLSTHRHFNVKFYNTQRSSKGSRALEHFLTSNYQDRHRSRIDMPEPLSAKIFTLIDALVDPDEGFKPRLYLECYPSFNLKRGEEHFRQSGRSHLADIRKVLRQQSLSVTDIPLGFYDDEYLALNPDLGEAIGTDYLMLILHFLRHGREENRLIGKWQLYIDSERYNLPKRITSPICFSAPEKRGVCVLIHVYYPDLVPELISYASNFKYKLQDIFINIVSSAWSPDLHAQIRSLCPTAFILISENTGRDIGGFIKLLEYVDTRKYTVFALMHTKKSPHIAKERGEHWRRQLLNAFAGNEEIAHSSITAFENDASIGLLGSKAWRGTDIAKNKKNYEYLLRLFGIKQECYDVEYLSGTMCLVRPEVLKRMFDVLKKVRFEGGDRILQDAHMDGQLAHAAERILGNVVRQMGYRFEWVES